ncbi:MAG: hypothetical protein M3R41_10850, partial [Pseudomonadota bacterium]|nr:hypothetical protein [Pseudomonadota bacterium]
AGQPALADFHPIADHPYRYDTVETRTMGETPERFAAHRTIVFHRDGAGWIASLTLDSVEHPDTPVGAMFAAANAGLLHRTTRLRLDTAGNVTGIDDIDAQWAAFVDGIEHLALSTTPAGAQRAKAAAAAAASLRAAPLAKRVSILASELPDMIARRQPGDEREMPQADGTIVTTTHSSADLPPAAKALPGATPATTRGTIVRAMVRRVDPATGLVLENRRETTITLQSAQAPTSRIEKTVILRPE